MKANFAIGWRPGKASHLTDVADPHADPQIEWWTRLKLSQVMRSIEALVAVQTVAFFKREWIPGCSFIFNCIFFFFFQFSESSPLNFCLDNGLVIVIILCCSQEAIHPVWEEIFKPGPLAWSRKTSTLTSSALERTKSPCQTTWSDRMAYARPPIPPLSTASTSPANSTWTVKPSVRSKHVHSPWPSTAMCPTWLETFYIRRCSSFS